MRPPACTSPLPTNIPGSRCFSASSARRADCELVSGDATATKPPTDSRVIDANAPSNSSTVAAGTMWSWTTSFPRAASNSLNTGGCEGVVGFQRTPIFVACGTACFSNSSCAFFVRPSWSKTMAREELKWQNIHADDLPAAVKKSFDAMVEAEATFKADLEKLLKDEGHMPEDKFLVMSRKGKRLGVAFASTPRGEGGAASLKFKTE